MAVTQSHMVKCADTVQMLQLAFSRPALLCYAMPLMLRWAIVSFRHAAMPPYATFQVATVR